MSREWAVFAEGQTWVWLAGGLLVTIRIAAVVVAISLVTGTLFALMRLSRFAILRWSAATYIDTMRATPVFLIIVFTYFGLPGLGIEVSTAVSVTAALTFYATALIAEIVRAGILAVPVGQIEAARSLGLGQLHTLFHVVLPQALRMMVPPLVGQYIILIKHTSIGGVVGLDELLRRSVILYNGYQNPAQALLVVAVIYFAFLYPLSMLSRRLELKDPRATSVET
jgi:His/Glu/Gln/Arg/opine family amino acid ABC transporter permease subunit